MSTNKPLQNQTSSGFDLMSWINTDGSKNAEVTKNPKIVVETTAKAAPVDKDSDDSDADMAKDVEDIIPATQAVTSKQQAARGKVQQRSPSPARGKDQNKDSDSDSDDDKAHSRPAAAHKESTSTVSSRGRPSEKTRAPSLSPENDDAAEEPRSPSPPAKTDPRTSKSKKQSSHAFSENHRERKNSESPLKRQNRASPMKKVKMRAYTPTPEPVRVTVRRATPSPDPKRASPSSEPARPLKRRRSPSFDSDRSVTPQPASKKHKANSSVSQSERTPSPRPRSGGQKAPAPPSPRKSKTTASNSTSNQPSKVSSKSAVDPFNLAARSVESPSLKRIISLPTKAPSRSTEIMFVGDVMPNKPKHLPSVTPERRNNISSGRVTPIVGYDVAYVKGYFILQQDCSDGNVTSTIREISGFAFYLWKTDKPTFQLTTLDQHTKINKALGTNHPFTLNVFVMKSKNNEEKTRNNALLLSLPIVSQDKVGSIELKTFDRIVTDAPIVGRGRKRERQNNRDDEATENQAEVDSAPAVQSSTKHDSFSYALRGITRYSSSGLQTTEEICTSDLNALIRQAGKFGINVLIKEMGLSYTTVVLSKHPSSKELTHKPVNEDDVSDDEYSDGLDAESDDGDDEPVDDYDDEEQEEEEEEEEEEKRPKKKTKVSK